MRDVLAVTTTHSPILCYICASQSLAHDTRFNNGDQQWLLMFLNGRSATRNGLFSTLIATGFRRPSPPSVVDMIKAHVPQRHLFDRVEILFRILMRLCYGAVPMAMTHADSKPIVPDIMDSAAADVMAVAA